MRSRIPSLALLATLSACATTVQQAGPAQAPPPPVKVFEPKIDLWSTGGSVVHRGEDIRVRFRTTDDGYVLVGRIDTDGRIEVLFPRRPGDVEHAWANQTYEVRRHGDAAFNVDDISGVGYVFAIVSPTPLRLSQFALGGDWDYRQISDVRGDPFVAMHHFAEQLVYDANDYYSMDYVEYDVERQYAYPRFVCYDCHRGQPGWDVYDHSCPRYRVVVYDDPEYYPYRQGGQRVVYARPRYEFKDVVARNGQSDQGDIEYRTRDGRIVDHRRPGDPTTDPNIQQPNGGRWGGYGNGNAGATRPGDDTDGNNGNRDQDQDRRRGGVGVNNGSGNGANNGNGDNRGRFGRPVVDTSRSGSNGGGNGNGNGGNGNGGNGNGGGNAGNHPQPPVIGGGNGNGNGGNGNGNGDCGRNGGNCGVGNGNGGGNGTGNEGNGNGPGSNNGNGNGSGHPQPPVTGNGGNGSNGNGNQGNGNNGNGNANPGNGNQGNGSQGNGNQGNGAGNGNGHGNNSSSAEPSDTRSKLLRNLGILKQRGDGSSSQPERKSEPKPDAKPRTDKVKDRDRSRPDSQ